MSELEPKDGAVDRRALIKGGLARGAAAAAGLAGLAAQPACAASPESRPAPPGRASGGPTMVGSANALPGMERFYGDLQGGAEPLDVAIEVVKLAEADPKDHSVGLGGLPDETGRVTLDAACMHGPTHNSGAVACLSGILHPSEVARLVMERTDHCMLVGEGAYRFARDHGHPHIELLTERAREIWMEWKESMSDRDDRLRPARPGKKSGAVVIEKGETVAASDLVFERRITGTIHCSALAKNGDVACVTTTSGLAWKIPGRVGDSPIIGAGLYCDQEVGSAGGTGRGESAILACASASLVEMMRAGMAPAEAIPEVLGRVKRQARRAAAWQPGLVRDDGEPAFDLQLYALDLQGRTAGMSLAGRGNYAVADPEGGPRLERLRKV